MGLFNELKKLTKPYDDEDDFEDFQPKKMDDLPPPPKTAFTNTLSVMSCGVSINTQSFRFENCPVSGAGIIKA